MLLQSFNTLVVLQQMSSGFSIRVRKSYVLCPCLCNVPMASSTLHSRVGTVGNKQASYSVQYFTHGDAIPFNGSFSLMQMVKATRDACQCNLLTEQDVKSVGGQCLRGSCDTRGRKWETWWGQGMVELLVIPAFCSPSTIKYNMVVSWRRSKTGADVHDLNVPAGNLE